MPLLNVTSVLTNPDLMDKFVVNRRTETIGPNGRSAVAEQTFNASGIVTAGSPNDLNRGDGFQTQGRSLTVVTKFRLQGEVTGRQPDTVVWRGDTFVVRAVDAYPHFGTGFFQAECTSTDKVDQPLDA